VPARSEPASAATVAPGANRAKLRRVIAFLPLCSLFPIRAYEYEAWQASIVARR
jgi:hypothetical protein